ncbi:MAG: hypothetical protein BGO11_11825 [Solirubrobacterales bacterium 70-9]|nr:MAG: hypothetical protein BGO11_11825 [Solirubrobacterales bacterium 70-9]
MLEVGERWKQRQSPYVMTKKSPPVRVDDRVILRVRKSGEIVRTTPWLMEIGRRFRGVQGALL